MSGSESNFINLYTDLSYTQSVLEMTMDDLRDEINHLEDGVILLVSFSDGG